MHALCVWVTMWPHDLLVPVPYALSWALKSPLVIQGSHVEVSSPRLWWPLGTHRPPKFLLSVSLDVGLGPSHVSKWESCLQG